MKLFQIPMVVTSLAGLCFLAGLGVPAAHADFTFGAPVNVKSTIPVLDPAIESIECFSYDGLEIYISSYNREGGYGEHDLWVLKRASINEDWGPPENLGPTVNSPNPDGFASISADGLTLYFDSNCPGGYGGWDIYITTRATKNDPWGDAVVAPKPINRTGNAADLEPWISPDGLEIYFTADRAGGYGNMDIWVARRTTEAAQWKTPVNLGPVVNSEYQEQYLSLSPDGLLLLFCDWCGLSDTPRPGGCGGGDMWMSRRATASDPWQTPVNLGPTVNTPGFEYAPRISADGSMLHFASVQSDDLTTWENWQAPILPIVDFNADEAVDLADLVLLIDNWGTDNSLYDIGPYAWGDGVVGIEDLKVFIAEWEKATSMNSQDDR